MEQARPAERKGQAPGNGRRTEAVVQAIQEHYAGIARGAGLGNVAFLKGRIEAVPLPASSVDVVISNRVINLSVDKAAALREAARVLRPGGRLAAYDVVALEPLPAAVRLDLKAWSRCESGALDTATYERPLREVGLTDVEILPVSAPQSTCCGGECTGLMRSGKSLMGKYEVGLADLAAMMQDFVEALMARARAKPGDKTIIDALKPAAEALKAAAAAGKTLAEGLADAKVAAQRGLEATKGMISQHGKAACFQEKTLGRQDPGATVGAWFVQVFADYVA